MYGADRRYHFFRKKPGRPAEWWSTRRDRSGTMHEFIEDLRQRYDVTPDASGDNYLITDKA